MEKREREGNGPEVGAENGPDGAGAVGAGATQSEREATAEKKGKVVDWAAEYGLFILQKHEKNFLLRINCREEEIAIDIFRTAEKCRDRREDGFEAIELMFSGKVEISRDDTGMIRNITPIVNPLHRHHGNIFGPQRGLTIAKMIKRLSKELISVEESVWLFFRK